ncbi:hypothetical protein [Methylorubrum extorquens]
MTTIHVVGLEPLRTRYTGEWDYYIPLQLAGAAQQLGLAAKIWPVSGGMVSTRLPPGAFLDPAATNIFKCRQGEEIARRFQNGQVQPGDVFLIADAWHPAVIQIRYMSALHGVRVRIINLWHAGSYDPHDLLGQIPDKRWAWSMERALFEAPDMKVFATRFHIELFCAAFDLSPSQPCIAQCGWPMEYLPGLLAPCRTVPKRKLVVFPHRYADEKQPEIFEDLAKEFEPEWQFEVCQHPDRAPLSKDAYHRLLGEARIVFSCSLQETLGIGCYEGVLAGAVPVVPDRLSYREMYPKGFRYPSEWTASWEDYLRHKPQLVDHLRGVLARAEAGVDLEPCRQQLTPFFSGEALYNEVFEGL